MLALYIIYIASYLISFAALGIAIYNYIDIGRWNKKNK